MFRDMCALYAFMRTTDDLGDDESLSLAERRQKLSDWRTQLQHGMDENSSRNPVILAIADVALRNAIPQNWLFEVIDGVASDLSARSFPTFAALEQYCYQVAGVVGLCCLRIWGYDSCDGQAEQQAIDCGTAFQLTNILRDLQEDARRGRVYLPTEDLTRFGVRNSLDLHTKANTQLEELLRFEVDRCWSYYRKALPLLDSVSDAGRPILSGFFQAYSSLLHRIEAAGCDVLSRRIGLSKYQKATIAVRSLFRRPAKIVIPQHVE